MPKDPSTSATAGTSSDGLSAAEIGALAASAVQRAQQVAGLLARLAGENAQHLAAIAEEERAEARRGEALRLAAQVWPLLVQFTDTSGALLPLLERLVQVSEPPP